MGKISGHACEDCSSGGEKLLSHDPVHVPTDKSGDAARGHAGITEPAKFPEMSIRPSKII
jgi:hypothetical protein